MDWEAISEKARDVMKELGHFGPTTRAEEGLVKGYMACDDGDDGRCYWSSDDLRKVAAGCIEVADWLDARAKAATEPQRCPSTGELFGE